MIYNLALFAKRFACFKRFARAGFKHTNRFLRSPTLRRLNLGKFTEAGNTWAERRARLGREKAFDIVIVRMDIKRKYAAEEFARARLERQLGGLMVLKIHSTTNIQPPEDQHKENVNEMGKDSAEDNPTALDITMLIV
ncbi:hypothetical protein BDV93DRAFT_516768 [Ceratobasidium sp. AG-I]|nr:hypothetical protein BDV93DRAFT_516768 [Ceratobasidium sp. AG-I]